MPVITRNEFDGLLFSFLKAVQTMEKNDRKTCGLNWNEQFLMKTLEQCESLTMSELAFKLSWEPFTLTRTADKLQKRGLVQRRQPQEDKRKTVLSLTDEGRSAVENVRRYHFDFILTNLGALPEEQQLQLFNAIGLLPSILIEDNTQKGDRL